MASTRNYVTFARSNLCRFFQVALNAPVLELNEMFLLQLFNGAQEFAILSLQAEDLLVVDYLAYR